MVASVVNPSESSTTPSGPLGVRHAMLIYGAPRSLFSRMEDTGAYGWTLVTLLGLVTLAGYAEVQTGLIDRTADQQTEARLAKLEESQAHLVDRIELRERMEDIRKQGEFDKTLFRLGAILFRPAKLLASLMFIAVLFYALVALTGRKPEYHTLMSICVYSAFIVLISFVVRLAMVVFYRTTAVDTSLGMLATPGKPSPLVAVDVFRIWFWVLVGMGLVTTRLLSRRMAVVTCALFALVAGGVRAALTFVGAS